MDATLHDGYRDVCDVAEDEVAVVAYYGGVGEVGDVGVGDGGGGLDVVGEAAEAGAKDDADGGNDGGAGLDVGDGGLRLIVEVGHRFILRAVAGR